MTRRSPPCKAIFDSRLDASANPSYVSCLEQKAEQPVKRVAYLSLAVVLLVPAPTLLGADVLVLKSGGRIEGDLLPSGDGATAEYYLIKTASGGTLKLAKALVERIHRKSEAEKQYETLLATMPDTADGHWAMADWCGQHGLRKERELHLRQVLRHDPNHEGARHRLGYSRVEGRWVKMDEWMASQGYVRHRGAWRLRQEVLLEEVAERRELAEKKWRKDLKMWRGWINKGRRLQAIHNFRAVDDPLAAMGLGGLLAEETSQEMKLLYIEILGRLKTPKAKIPLVVAALEDDSQHIRDACLDQLEKQGRRTAVTYLIKMLDPKRNPNSKKINRAGIALGRLGGVEAIGPMIDALVTEHKVKAPGNGSGGLSLSPTFSRNGGPAGFSIGGRPKLVKRKVRNEGVLYGLKAITGEDFRFDQDAWRKWYVEAHTPVDVALRRDG